LISFVFQDLRGSDIFYLSSIPYLGIKGLDEIANQISRKSIHVIIYGILTLLIWYSFPKLDIHLPMKIFVCAVLSILFAISDEFHQYFIPGRCCNAEGVFFDLIGIAAVIAWLGIKDRGRKSDVGKGQKSRQKDGGQAEVGGQMSEGQEQETAAYAQLRRGREDGKGQRSRQKDGGQAEVGDQKSEGQ
jgi:VanZ family protein